MLCQTQEKTMMVCLERNGIQGVFLTGPAQKFISVKDDKIPTKKVKVGHPTARCEVLTLTFTFLVGILPASTLRTFWAGPVKKNTL